MPRPGPRPYECVRRAWHSDRHQPMRGSLIQEIFRVANEVHSPVTRKNKEWQEKLPVVVLKAEEIIYSKANSEGEYMDPKTLWDRANDAIDTIIRKDDTPETEDLLLPCIEAALNLGCVPRRATRSQRHNNPGIYLSSSARDTAANETCAAPSSSKAHLVSPPQLMPLHHNHPNSLVSPNSQSSHSKDTIYSCQDGVLSIPMETSTWPEIGGRYPLYYSENKVKTNFRAAQNLQDPISYRSVAEMPHVPFMEENFLGCKITKDASQRSSNFEEVLTGQSNARCDLALRLGLPSPPYVGAVSGWSNEFDDFGSSSSGSGKTKNSPLSSKDKSSGFFGLDTNDDRVESCSSKGSSVGEGVFYVEAPGGKYGRSVVGSFGNGYVYSPLLNRSERMDS